MKRTEMLQEIRKMQFEEVFADWGSGKLTQEEAARINSRIETLWKTACGFRNKTRLRTVILIHFGGLDLYPVTHGKP